MAYYKLAALVIACLIQVSLASKPVNPVKDSGVDSYGTQKIYSNRIDHFDASNTQTFGQRYCVNDTFAQPNGPVVLYICGEYQCSAGETELAAFELGIKYNATLLTLEHRFYGESQPFNSTAGGWSYSNLKYLNTT